MGYKKRMPTKIVRTVHEVTFWDGAGKQAIITCLDKVPPGAKLDIDVSEIGEESNLCKLIFIEEASK